MREWFDALLVVASDKRSEFYTSDGGQRRGAGHRCAFWDGYNGMTRSANAVPRTMSGAAFQAGREFKRREKRRPTNGS